MLTLSQLLHAAVFFYLVPCLLCGNLRCFYRPILEKEVKYGHVVTECRPDEVCFKAEGRFGNYSALSASGCMPRKNCRWNHELPYKGVVFTISYKCCNRLYCNACVGLKANTFSIALTLATIVVVAS
ncbi:protein Bouncer [Entelurus aequoreus]|uniref:protein Bouncer n=1 Tax=Entelurus aequoreus TaxID=161455 RepID=UPI002B1E78A8|nr:protein Bouncer [Entelurus aequoreus]